MIKNDKWPNYQEADYSMCMMSFDLRNWVFLCAGGASGLPSEIYRFVDVRDVAYAHIQALEIPSASGRYCLVGRVAHFSDAVKIAHELYPTLPLPEK